MHEFMTTTGIKQDKSNIFFFKERLLPPAQVMMIAFETNVECGAGVSGKRAHFSQPANKCLGVAGHLLMKKN